MPVTTTIPAGTKGADFTVPTAAIDAWLDANHGRYVIRYIAGGGAWKHITPAEIAHHHARGIAVVLNYEGSTTDHTGGTAAGTRNGNYARLVAQALGYPTGLPLVVSVDTGLTTTALPIAVAYVKAFFAAAAPYAPALYGPVNLYQQVRKWEPFYWMPNATSWQTGLKPTDVVHVRQQRSQYPPAIDPNVTVSAFPAWLPQPDPEPPEVLPVEYFVRFKGTKNVFHVGAGGAVHVEGSVIDKGRGVLGDPLVIDHKEMRVSVCHAAGIDPAWLTPTEDGS
jgi:hypothetical protein